jgi:fibronectin type 3 domain-containing protein
VPRNVVAVLVGPTAVSVKWDRAARAGHYRVWKRELGVDEQFVAVRSTGDRDITIEGLPHNATIEIAVSAVNNGGESARSAVVTLVTQ